MFKKLNGWIKTGTLSHMKVVGIGLLFSILLANCNSGDRTAKENITKTANDDSTGSRREISSDPGQEINWLDVRDQPGWDTIPFTSDPEDSSKIEKEKRNIRVYVRGWLAELNAGAKTGEENGYVVKEFSFVRKSRSPLRYEVKAFLNPPVRIDSGSHSHERTEEEGPGGHLIPPPPPPPGRD